MKIKETVKKHKRKLILGGGFVCGTILFLVGKKWGKHDFWSQCKEMYTDLIRENMGDLPKGTAQYLVAAEDCGLKEYGDLIYEIKLECIGD